MTTVLLTGFEPFGGDTDNPSGNAVHLVAATWDGPESLVTAILPVTFAGAAAELDRLVAEHSPDVIVATGLAGGRAEIAIERVAVNLVDARIPDNSGHRPTDEPSIEGAQNALFSTLPAKAIARAVSVEGIPCTVSLSAGTFVCNHVFFAAAALAERTGIRAGFIHVPWDDEHAPKDTASLPLRTIADAIRIAVRTTLDSPSDIVAVGGALH